MWALGHPADSAAVGASSEDHLLHSIATVAGVRPQKKRQEHASTDARTEEARRQYEQQGSSGPYGGTTGAWPFKTDPNDVPHFNREGHYRTTTTLEEQLKKGRSQRRQMPIEKSTLEEDSPVNVIGRFVTICGILALGIGTPLIFFGGNFTS